MSTKLQKIYDFLYAYELAYVFEKERRPKGGRPRSYTHTSFILFFIAMFLHKAIARKLSG